MLSELRRHPWALVISLGIHLLVIVAMVVNLQFSDKPKMTKAGPVTKTIKAEVVNQQQLEDREKQKRLEQDRNQAAIEKKKDIEAKKRADKKKIDAEKKRKAEANKKAEQKRKKEADIKRKAADKKKADQKRKADDKRKAEAAKAAEQKRKAEETRIAKEKRKADEAKRLEEERKRKQAEQRRLAEEEQKRKEEELKAKLQAEENQRRLNTLREAYILAIAQKVERNWQRPAGSEKMPECEVNVLQGPGGIILDVNFGACGGSTATYRASIENAVYKAEPLPKPADPALFDRDIKFTFRPFE